MGLKAEGYSGGHSLSCGDDFLTVGALSPWPGRGAYGPAEPSTSSGCHGVEALGRVSLVSPEALEFSLAAPQRWPFPDWRC